MAIGLPKRQGRGPVRAASSSAAVLAGLLLLTVAPHGLVAYVDWNTYDLVTGVFGASSDGEARPGTTPPGVAERYTGVQPEP